MPYCKFCGVQIAAGTQCVSCASPKQVTASTQPPAGAVAKTPAARDTARKRSVHTSQIVSGVWVAASVVWIIFSPAPVFWFLLLSPSLIACIWPLSKNARLSAWIAGQEGKLQERLARAETKTGKIATYFFKPLYRGCLWIWRKAGSVQDPDVRAGIRVGSLLYFVSAMLLIGITVGYILVAVVVAIMVIGFILWLTLAVLSSEQSEKRSGGLASSALRGVRSKPTTDWLGNPKTNVYADDGTKIAEVRPATDIFGNPKENVYNNAGEKIGEQRPTTDIFGNSRTNVYDSAGNKTGESHATTDWLGNRVEKHYNNKGDKVGESRPGTDFLGNPVVKHEWEDKE